jgi:hypothetical protein
MKAGSHRQRTSGGATGYDPTVGMATGERFAGFPANRVLGHDGTLVSADDVAQASGVPVELEGDPVWWSSRYATWGWWVVVLFRANSDELSWLWVRVRTPGRVAIPKPKAARKAAAAETVASTTSKTGHARVHAGKHLTSRDNQWLLTSEP